MLVKAIIVSLAVASLLCFQPQRIEAEPQIIKPLTIDQMVIKYSKEYNVSSSLMFSVMNCENPDKDPTLQSRIVKHGVREPSYGLAQIHLPSHPDVTKAEATDPDFSIQFLAKGLKTNPKMWSCYKKLGYT